MKKRDPCSKPPRTNSSICGGFFDVAKLKRRLDELEAEMAKGDFWDHRERAQKLMEEATGIRRKVEPLELLERQVKDLTEMVDLAEASSPEEQQGLAAELNDEVDGLGTRLETLELEVHLSGAHDRANCILNINAGAGGTESCDWADMLFRMYQRWA
ncbi:MAG: PCRF domain-containing protein, partial [Verrucomicrobiae bacterium]|nr:PCRF domain-containing protein [Verrucomicrobiae bacterium]